VSLVVPAPHRRPTEEGTRPRRATGPRPRRAAEPRPRRDEVHPATASAALACLLRGPCRPVEVVAAFERALYLEHAGGLLALETCDGVHLPNGVVLVAHSAARVLGARHRCAGGMLGDGALVVGDLQVRVVRWRRARPVLRPADGATLARGLLTARAELLRRAGPAPAALAGPLRELTAALGAADPSTARQVARRSLLGRGPGLTPSGDDVLAGLLAGVPLLAEAVGIDPGGPLPITVAEVGTTVVASSSVTTALSAALLHHAVRGEVSAPVELLLLALVGQGSPGPALERLLAVGSTSGRDLALGLLAGAELVLSTSGPSGR
jgi:hypothetical protein